MPMMIVINVILDSFLFSFLYIFRENDSFGVIGYMSVYIKTNTIQQMDNHFLVFKNVDSSVKMHNTRLQIQYEDNSNDNDINNKYDNIY